MALGRDVTRLEGNGPAQPIRFGLAELEPEVDLERLLTRADEALIEGRRTLVTDQGARSVWCAHLVDVLLRVVERSVSLQPI